MKEYVDTVGKTLFSQNELIEILTWDINDDLKISLLKMSKEPISIIEKGYSTAVCLHILSNNFAESDLPSLFSSFEQWDDSIQEKVFDHAVNNISCIIDNQNSIPKKLIKSLLNSETSLTGSHKHGTNKYKATPWIRPRLSFWVRAC